MLSASDGLVHIADCLLTHLCHDFSIPSAVTPDMLNRIASELEFMWYSMYSYPSIQEFSKVGIGFLIAEMWQVKHALECLNICNRLLTNCYCLGLPVEIMNLIMKARLSTKLFI